MTLDKKNRERLSHCRILAQYFRRSRFLNINTMPLLPLFNRFKMEGKVGLWAIELCQIENGYPGEEGSANGA